MPLTMNVESKQPQGTYEVESPKGKFEGKEPVGDPVTVSSDQPMANVGLKVGMTKNLGNYESVRVDVSCFIPCLPAEPDMDAAFSVCEAWCDAKISALLENL